MGGLESRFNTLLVEGRAEEAMTMWEENFELQTRHQPNSQIKASQYRDTPLHCAVRFEMKDMLQEFLTRGGNPFVMNGNEETPLHIVCRAAKISSRKAKKRAEFLRMMLDRIPTEESFEVMYSTSQEMGNSIGRGLSFGSSEKGLSEKGLDESLSRYEKGLSMDSSFQSSVSGLSNGDLSLKSIADVDAHYLGVQDKSRNTPLHLAAASGLLECVELLVAHNAPLFVRNVADQTPCDVAKESKEIIIAKQLESKMVFDYHGGLSDESSPNKRVPNKALRSVQAIKELREGIVKQVADRLKRSTTDTQALLMAYGWSEELLMEAWNSDKAATCERAGISVGSVFVEETTPYVSLITRNCGICDEEIPADQKTVTPCEHNFCRDCWKMYIEGQITDGGGKEIRCPAFQCYKIVPDDTIARLISEKEMEKYTELSVKQFVDTSSDIRWCPYPDCGYAICIKNEGKDKKEEKTKGGGGVAVGRASSSIMKLTPGKNVECGQGHGFCWNCMKDPHEPCSCELWEKWKEVILGNMSEEDKSRVAHEAQANAHWIIRNTKPCPNCKAPIQKNEGCNHMTCNKCRHDFCWVCLDPWRLHSHRTGGYFTCNRWNAQAKANRDVEKARSTMEKDYVVKAKSDLKKQKEKYEHHHSRYNNHLQSLDIEVKLLQDSQAKLREMERLGQALDKKVAAVRAQALMENEENVTEEFADEACRSFPHLKGNFLDDIFRSLLHARRILAASYCIGYFLPEDKTHEIQEHEKLQGRLEAAVETLSQMVNREYLLTPQYKMKEVARDVDTLCEGYVVAMQQVATIAGRIITGIEEAERREERERERQRQRQPQEAPPTMDDIFFLNFLQMFDGNGRLHIFVPQTTPTRGQ